MNERRIQKDEKQEDPRSRLKHIAGLILALPYRDMVDLGNLLEKQANSTVHDDFPQILVEVSEKILGEA